MKNMQNAKKYLFRAAVVGCLVSMAGNVSAVSVAVIAAWYGTSSTKNQDVTNTIQTKYVQNGQVNIPADMDTAFGQKYGTSGLLALEVQVTGNTAGTIYDIHLRGKNGTAFTFPTFANQLTVG